MEWGGVGTGSVLTLFALFVQRKSQRHSLPNFPQTPTTSNSAQSQCSLLSHSSRQHATDSLAAQMAI